MLIVAILIVETKFCCVGHHENTDHSIIFYSYHNFKNVLRVFHPKNITYAVTKGLFLKYVRISKYVRKPTSGAIALSVSRHDVTTLLAELVNPAILTFITSLILEAGNGC